MDSIALILSCWEPCLEIQSSSGFLGSYSLDWLCARSRACVARLMIWARQLDDDLCQCKEDRMTHRIKTYRTCLLSTFQGLPVTPSICLANSLAIVSILLVLSQVTCPICFINCQVVIMSQDLPCVWCQAVGQSWTGPAPIEHRDVHCSFAWSRGVESWPPTRLVSSPASMSQWPQSTCQC